MKKQQPERFLYLAVPKTPYETFFQLPFVADVIDHFQLSIIVYDPKDEEMLLWKK
ncbi:element excision factor XisH family protein [Sphaerospermopsis aphanizomenoides]|uniref:element excision factor XisH family protein n=1 Tax=Sphaerospermopsis aphanizomenoides TaxID=459663 RepID=UPI002D7F7A1B|nr:element excision factor XisH family protein [Sphaerospermopsis aphanizomenoides]